MRVRGKRRNDASKKVRPRWYVVRKVGGRVRCRINSNKRHCEWKAMGGDMSNGWISVKDRLPDEDEMVLTYSPTSANPVSVGELCGAESWVLVTKINTIDDVDYDSVPTHWMPLPAPPATVPIPLTKIEALREAMKILHLFVNRECGGTQWTQEEIVTGCGQLPRLRAALESED